MANELTLSGAVVFDDNSAHPLTREFETLRVSLNTVKCISNLISVGTSEEAIPLGEVSTLGVAYFKNLDPTNYVEIRAATGGTKILKLKAGESQLIRFGSGITAPFIIADTAACRVEYLLFND